MENRSKRTETAAELFSYTLTELDARGLLPERHRRSHKGTYGHALIAAGSENMGGCALLACEAAYRTGTGLVTCLSHSSNRTALISRLPEVLFAERNGIQTPEFCGRYTAAAAGPGIGLDADYSESCELVRFLLQHFQKPLLLDADALTILGRETGFQALLRARDIPVILTPHPGEMHRLCPELSIPDIMQDPVSAAAAYAAKTGSIVLLKDAETVVTDGNRVYLNSTGCNGMACGGSGDVLTGIICGFLAQGMKPFEAACLGACVHGLAGMRAADEMGNRGMLAGDIVRYLPRILKEME